MGLEKSDVSPGSPSLHYLRVAVSLGWQDVKDTYQRSALGPVWITLGLAIQISAIGAVFGLLLGADVSVYIPFLSISFVLWNFMLISANESALSFVQSERLLKQTALPKFFPVLRSFAKNSIILAHNFSIIFIVVPLFRIDIGPSVFLAIPGLAILLGNMYWISTVIGIVSTRYRDLPPIVSSFFMISFYVTPILWMPETLPENFRQIVVTFNPFFHLMEIVRAPLMGNTPETLNWVVAIGALVIGSLIALQIHRKYSRKIVYWL